MEPLVFRWESTAADLIAVRRRVLRPQLVRSGVAGVLALWALCAIIWWQTGSAPLAGFGAGAWPLTVIAMLALEPRRQVGRARRAGLLSVGPMVAELGPGGVSWVQEGASTRLRWDAFQATHRDRWGLWLDVGLAQHLLIPARALGTRPLDAIERWRAAPEPLTPLAFGDGVGAWTLTCDLELDDWLLAIEASFSAIARQRVVRLGLLVLAMLSLLWVLASLTRPSPWLVASAVTVLAGWAGVRAFAAPRLRRWSFRRRVHSAPRQLPLGPAVWRVGPGGLWVSSSRGTTRYSWSHVGGIERDAAQVRMTVGLAVLVIPGRAFASDFELDRFTAEARAWIEAAPPPRDGRALPPRAPLAGDVDPFAPPPDGR